MISTQKICLFMGAIFLLNSPVFSQKREVTLEDITINQTFTPKEVDEMVFLNNENSYATVADSGKSIEKYDILTGNKISKLLDLSKFEDLKIKNIDGFEFSGDDNLILLYTNKVKVYRHSFTASYYTYNCSTHELLPLSDKNQIGSATVSPDGNFVAFEWKNNLYLKKLRFGTESAITEDGAKDSIRNGMGDWVYEEEFKVTRAFEWNSASTDLAYIRFDETKVKLYPLEVSNNTIDAENFYPLISYVKYPKAGEANAEISVNVFNVSDKTTKVMDLGKNRDIYVPRIFWTNSADRLAVVRMNRLQNQFDLLSFNPKTGVANSLYSQTSDTFVDADMANTIEFLPEGKGFVITSEQDGFSHLYHYNLLGIKQAQITTGKWDVTAYYGYNALKHEVYYQSADESPLQRTVWASSLDGKSKRKLSLTIGTNEATFNTTHNYLIINHSSLKTPNSITLFSVAGKEIRILQNNSELSKLVANVELSPKEFFSFKTTGGIELNGWLVKPANYSDGAKHPLVLMQYSGPNSQEVTDSWEIGWEQYLASKGFVVACVDGRGTGARGRDFRNCTYLKLGKLETEDQVETAKYFAQKDYVDANRIAIWGWSFGGYMACNVLTNGGGTFKLGIAVAPVTNWKFYDTVYAERFLKRPRDNERGYAQNSPYYQAQNLQGRLFIIQGQLDDNVHFQNLTEYANQLISNNKQFDMFVYPKRNHSIKGGTTRLHLYNMMTDYLIKNL